MIANKLPDILHLSERTENALPYITFFVLFAIILSQLSPSRNKAPIVNPKRWSEWSWNRVGKEFAFNSKEILRKAAAKYNGKPFQVFTTQGFITVLDPKYIDETRNDARLSFDEHIQRAFHGDVPGFYAFDQRNNMSWFLTQIAQKHLTAYLNQITIPLSEECDTTLKQYLTDNKDWHEITAMYEIGRIISRMSSRIFLGPEFCEDDKWLEASSRYAVNLFDAQEKLSLWSPMLRPIVHWFLPYTRQLRADFATCKGIIESRLKERKKDRLAKEKQGLKADAVQDTLEWIDKVAKSKNLKYDPTKIQLSLSMAAIHTTTDLITWLLVCLARNPEIIPRLREEMITVLKAEGWKKTALYNLKLLDSVMKESQRLKPNVLAVMRRRAMKDVTLSDGVLIPKDTMTLVYSSQMRDPTLYPNPDDFNPDRFLKMRQIPGKENHAQFVTTSPQHMGFSHGQHSCPGRFFAANETKILLCHLLLKYDIRAVKESHDDSVAFGFALIPNPYSKLEIRRRKEEIDLSSLRT